jgi:hypothetical protein
MGQEQSLYIGNRSLKNNILDDSEIDYKSPENKTKAKNELYSLFIDEKLVHITKIKEIDMEISKLHEEIYNLKKEIHGYKKLNKQEKIANNKIKNISDKLNIARDKLKHNDTDTE